MFTVNESSDLGIPGLLSIRMLERREMICFDSKVAFVNFILWKSRVYFVVRTK